MGGFIYPIIRYPKMSLKNVTIRNIKPKKSAYKFADEKRLFLFVKPNGSKSWRFKYRFAGKEKLLSIGLYPEASLAYAREVRDKARKLLVEKIDPALTKQVSKRAAKLTAENSFESLAREGYIKHSSKWTPNHGERIIRRLERDIFPWLGCRPIIEITAEELLNTLRRIETRGAIETAHRAHQNCGQIFLLCYCYRSSRARCFD